MLTGIWKIIERRARWLDYLDSEHPKPLDGVTRLVEVSRNGSI